MVEINVDEYYSNVALYPYIPASIFEALEAAFLNGSPKASVPMVEYSRMLNAIYNSKVCPEH